MAAFLLAYEPAKRLARVNLDIIAQLVGVRALFEIIDAPETETIEDGKPPLQLKDARVEFDNVRFAYRPDERRCGGMSLSPADESNGVVGPS